MAKAKIFNPFKENVRDLLVSTFEKQQLLELPPANVDVGCGVYALYYVGNHKAYSPLAKSKKYPIYVGKAVVPGGRKGGGDPKKASSNFVTKRLREHAKTIAASPTLNLKDFECRWLLVVPEFTNAAEAILIDHYKPIWNKFISGFGIHHPGGGRLKQARSDWDMLHPGRAFAEKLPKGRASELIEKSLVEHFKIYKLK
ncbi:MAG: Eco29kI family restriction endonuclease [Bdellovibrionales bacterium]|nr:Eco29kI family restriction endonuclease [Bdellovibrionales bacterium]